MLDFKAKMHQIRFPLWLRPRPRWGCFAGGAYSALPDPLAVFKGSDGEGEGRVEERRGKGRRGGGKRRGSSHAFCFSNLGSSELPGLRPAFASRFSSKEVVVEVCSFFWTRRRVPKGHSTCSCCRNQFCKGRKAFLIRSGAQRNFAEIPHRSTVLDFSLVF